MENLEKYSKIIEITKGNFAVNVAGMWIKIRTEENEYLDE